MARIKLELPETYTFSTLLPIRITDLNYGGHVGNDTVVSLLHEARMQYLSHYGYSELDLGGISLIMGDLAIEYKGEVFYGNSAGENLTLPTQDTRDVIGVAMRSLDRIWLDGRRYMKAGIMLDDFTPNGVSQLNLLDEDKPRANSAQLMQVLDGINQSGLGRVWFAGQGIDTEWKMKRDMLSPAWTTRWSDIPVARVI